MVPISADLARIVTTLCIDISTPRSLTVEIMVRYCEWDQLANLEVDPLHYNSPLGFKLDACITGLLRKMVDLPTTYDRRKVAVDNFWKSEFQCCRTNVFLSRFEKQGPMDLSDARCASFLERVRKKIDDILGPVPREIWGKFGPGATFGDKGVYTTIPDKMSSSPTITPDAWPVLVEWAHTAWAKALRVIGKDLTTVRGNRFTSVWKDCRKDRGICIEPSINLFYQLGIGRAIRSRLKLSGIDLEVAQELHRALARAASLTGLDATIDLSNASDTLCKVLVRILISPDWYRILTMVRSQFTTIDEKVVALEKFSSMGNGYTFELETLIFLGISLVAVEDAGLPAIPGSTVHVFGDDIIVPTAAAESVLSALRFCGFSPNKGKTFVTGQFRESCGGDYFNGVAVRPHFLKESPNEPQDWIAMANGILRASRESSSVDGPGPYFLRAWFGVLNCIPSQIRRCRGPEVLGDLVIHDNASTYTTRWRSGIRYFQVYRPARFERIRWRGWINEVIYACALYSPKLPERGLIPRDGVRGYKLGWVPYS